MLAGLIAIGEGGVRTRVVAVGLAQSGARDHLLNPDRIDLTQRVVKALRLTDVRQRLGIAQMGVRIHESNLAAKESRRLRSLENALRAAVIGHRPIEKPHAVRPAQYSLQQP